MKHKHTHTQGFKLSNLLATLTIAAVLASIALPLFRGQMEKSRRADVRTTIMEILQQQEAYFTENNSYTQDLRDLGYSSQNWNDSKEGLYQIRIMTSNGSCGLPECIHLYVRPRSSESQAGDLEFRLWSTGKKQYKDGGSWKNGWGS